MPSALGQNIFAMEKQKMVAESCTFICTICGDGFSQYQNVLSHMSIHGPLESFTFDGSSNGFEVPREYVLQDNGTLTVLTGFSGLTSTQYSTKRPSSPGILPSHFSYAANSAFPSQEMFRDVTKPLDLYNSHGELYHCEVCGRTFNSLQFLHRHQQYRNLDGGYRCTLCCRFFNGRMEHKKHMQNHTYERFHCCTYCGKRFVKMDALKDHVNHNHLSDGFESSPESKLERSYTCKKCKLSFFWLTDFQIHSFYLCRGREVSAAFESEGASRVNHKNCNGTPIHARNGVKKLIKSSSEADSTYRCGLCGERFPELTALKEHHITHESQQKIKNTALKSKSVKKLMIKGNRRMKKKHFKVQIHSCKLCRCVFHHSNSLTQHMRYHKDTVQIVKLALDQDNKNDSSEKERATHGNYKCNKCEKVFGLLCVFKTHLRHHRKESKAAAESTSSTKHEKTCRDTTEVDTHEATPSAGPAVEESHVEDTEENHGFSAPNDEENAFEPVHTCTDCSQTFACMETFVQHQLCHGSEK